MGNSRSRRGRVEAELDNPIQGVSYKVVFSSEPFDKGACRLAFKGVYRGKGPLNGRPCVTKIFIDEAQRYYSEYIPDVEASVVANDMAQEFNAAFSSSKPFRFIVPELATVTRVPDGTDYAKIEDKILVEEFIAGNYEKFNSNGGFENDRINAAGAPTFSHFTFWKSNEQLLVCDIQGVRNQAGYVLTDPAVLSREQGRYGPTDIGPVGMANFFKNHKCGSVCEKFGWPEIDASRQVTSRRGMRGSSYTFMLPAEDVEANRHFRHRRQLPAIKE